MLNMNDLKKHLMVATVQVSPPAGVTAWLTMGNHLDTWIKLATLIYIVGQICFLGVKAWAVLHKRWIAEIDDGPD
jgi:hypothetical protein